MTLVIPGAAADIFSGLADPTRPDSRVASTVQKKSRQVPLLLSSTFMGPDSRSAIINGKRVREGQKIEGAAVVSIRSHSVVVRRGGRKQVLRFQVPADSDTDNKQGQVNATASANN